MIKNVKYIIKKKYIKKKSLIFFKESLPWAHWVWTDPLKHAASLVVVVVGGGGGVTENEWGQSQWEEVMPPSRYDWYDWLCLAMIVSCYKSQGHSCVHESVWTNNIMVLIGRLIKKASKHLTHLDIKTLFYYVKIRHEMAWKHGLWEFLVSNQLGEIESSLNLRVCDHFLSFDDWWSEKFQNS